MTKTSSYHTMLFRINQRIKDECPEIIELVNQLQNYLNEEVMVDLNYKVDEEKQKTKDVAYNFLLENNLIK
ncbi:MAG: glycine betaine ABC transporter substrate-binding protein [Thomasclavelia ramosa]